MSDDLLDCSKLADLIAVVRKRGYNEEALHKISCRNLLRMLEAD